MLPKIETALESVLSGVYKICIGDIAMVSDNKDEITIIKAIGQ